MPWYQKRISLEPRRRGFHLVTRELVGQLPELGAFKVGLAHFFVQHTSASLTISENADPDVRTDLEEGFNVLAPERAPYYTHTMEGPDDMPAHIKNCLLGAGVLVPIAQGRLALGTWQGLYLCEHRNHASGRNLVVTLFGEQT